MISLAVSTPLTAGGRSTTTSGRMKRLGLLLRWTLPDERASFPETLPAIEYGPADIVRKVDINGDIRLKSEPAGQQGLSRPADRPAPDQRGRRVQRSFLRPHDRHARSTPSTTTGAATTAAARHPKMPLNNRLQSVTYVPEHLSPISGTYTGGGGNARLVHSPLSMRTRGATAPLPLFAILTMSNSHSRSTSRSRGAIAPGS